MQLTRRARMKLLRGPTAEWTEGVHCNALHSGWVERGLSQGAGHPGRSEWSPGEWRGRWRRGQGHGDGGGGEDGEEARSGAGRTSSQSGRLGLRWRQTPGRRWPVARVALSRQFHSRILPNSFLLLLLLISQPVHQSWRPHPPSRPTVSIRL